MIKTEEVDSSSNGLLYNNSNNRMPLPPISTASSLHYSMLAPAGSILSDLNAINVNHHHHHPYSHHLQQPHHLYRQPEEKPNISYMNRHILHNGHSIIQDMMPPPPLSASPINANKSESPNSTVFTTPTSTPQDFNTASTIKYCSSNGLEILPVQPPPPQHAYVIQQCHSSEAPSLNRPNEVSNHEDRMETLHSHPSMQHSHHQTVLSSSSSTGASPMQTSGGQLEVVHYAGVQQQHQERKKDAASPISSAGSRSPTGDQQLPPDTTKKSNNNTRRPEKPNLSYINMIAMAIKESPDRMLTLNGIYNYLQQK